MIQYFVDDYLILVLVIGFILLFINRLKVKTNKNRILEILLIEVAAITVFDTFEYYFSSLDSFNYWRLLLSFLCYSLRPLIIITFITLLTDNKNIKYYYSLSIINAIVYASCFFSNIAFSFSSENSFYRGPLGYTVHIVCIIYALLFLILIIKRHYKNEWTRTFIHIYILLTCFVAAFLDMVSDSTLFDKTVLICILVYYLFVYMDHSKVDELTDIYNRNKFYNDMNQYNHKITSIIAFDMNGLKAINDTYGHAEGDKALKTIAKCLLKNIKYNVKFYRIGGDEFAGLCLNIDEDKVKMVINNIKSDLSKTKYSISCGYVMCDSNDDKNDIYKQADEMMYKDKEDYYSNHERRHNINLKK